MARVTGKKRCPSCEKAGKDKHKDNLILYNDGSAYCFSCGYYEHKNKIFIQKTEPIKIEGEVLPEDIVPLNKNHAGYYWLKEYLNKIPHWILWSPNKQWLIFPYFIDGRLECWQARNFSGSGPKWLTFGKPTDIVYVLGTGEEIVLVEDIVSALKIEQAGGCASPLFGCIIPMNRLLRLSSRFSRVRVWLDPDKALEASQQAYKALKLGFNISTCKTDKDPKEHTDDFIRETLGLSEGQD